MSRYTISREAILARFAADHGVSPIDANALATDWEFEANRQGVESRAGSFWLKGREWMTREILRRRRPGGGADVG
jgi:hypothetical protein